jgi:hypothetical protein
MLKLGGARETTELLLEALFGDSYSNIGSS